ncbi:hypothetical protein CIPAW_02G012900 [Carya illinoinensis]|uniref:Uncharacterized protein n=1 Tax=Carya illinoinensis TaxID=32201 RepID=A0A8T1R9T6_CARIL|nr:hypothetical protein CIPAW_02G012900 [Carya illinoinensis]
MNDNYVKSKFKQKYFNTFNKMTLFNYKMDDITVHDRSICVAGGWGHDGVIRRRPAQRLWIMWDKQGQTTQNRGPDVCLHAVADQTACMQDVRLKTGELERKLQKMLMESSTGTRKI